MIKHNNAQLEVAFSRDDLVSIYQQLGTRLAVMLGPHR
jgi:hypothetical protein